MAADAGSGGNGGNDGVVFVTDRAKEAHCASPQEGVGQGVSGFRFRPRGGEGMEEEEHQKIHEQGPKGAGPALQCGGRRERLPLSQRSVAFLAGTPI